MKGWRISLVVVVCAQIGLSGVILAVADPRMSSGNFSINENEVGGSGQFDATSGSFKILGGQDGGSSLGETAVGNSGSANFQTNSGFNTTAQPSLTFIINNGLVDLGVLSTAAKSTATATFLAKNYTSYGYIVSMIGTAPAISGHTLSALATDTASSAGTEQFGVNLVRNTVAAVGADPVQVPAGPPTFGYGVAGDGSTNNYKQSDKWRFANGETIASAPRSSGETDYTMTFMANISPVTPAGKYTSNLVLVCTGTF